MGEGGKGGVGGVGGTLGGCTSGAAGGVGAGGEPGATTPGSGLTVAGVSVGGGVMACCDVGATVLFFEPNIDSSRESIARFPYITLCLCYHNYLLFR